MKNIFQYGSNELVYSKETLQLYDNFVIVDDLIATRNG